VEGKLLTILPSKIPVAPTSIYTSKNGPTSTVYEIRKETYILFKGPNLP
jgi:hypothetical protein